MNPQRIQRRRTRGWRMPEGAVCVGRPSRWGNPFRIGETAWVVTRDSAGDVQVVDAAHAVRLFEEYVDANADLLVPLIREHLAGKDLACWCRVGYPCHADVLLRIANTELAA